MTSLPIINPCKNEYNENDENFNIAEKFLKLPFLFYVDTIINCDKIFLSDSSFFCLSMQLPIKTSDCHLVTARCERRFDYLWEGKEDYLKKINKPIFKQYKNEN